MSTPGAADPTPTTAPDVNTGGTSLPQGAPPVDPGPDAVGSGSVHVPGASPSASVLPGPASMKIGGGKGGKGRGKKKS